MNDILYTWKISPPILVSPSKLRANLKQLIKLYIEDYVTKLESESVLDLYRAKIGLDEFKAVYRILLLLWILKGYKDSYSFSIDRQKSTIDRPKTRYPRIPFQELEYKANKGNTKHIIPPQILDL